jgi:hypothetical protein
MSIKIDGVPAELLRRAYWELDAGTPSIATLAELKAVLDAPVVERQYEAYTTQPAESLAGMAARQLKDEGRWIEIRDANALEFPDMAPHDYYPVGSVIRIPCASPPAPVAVPEKYDDVLLPFLALMREELHANAHKGDRPGWLQMDSKTAILEVFYHMGKLHQAVHRGEEAAIKEYAADVANMCMMLVDIYACLDKVKELNQ